MTCPAVSVLDDGETQLLVSCDAKSFQSMTEILHQSTWP